MLKKDMDVLVHLLKYVSYFGLDCNLNSSYWLNFLSIFHNMLKLDYPCQIFFFDALSLHEDCDQSDSLICTEDTKKQVFIYLMYFRRISDNNFSGKIPEFIGKWKKIQKL